MILYQFSNFYQIVFIVFFSVLLIVSIAAGILFLPLVKLVFQNGNPIIARISLLLIIIIVYLLCLSLSVFSIKNISQYYSMTRDIDIENCSVAIGEIEDLEKIPQYSRGANITSYYLKFRIDNLEYYIDTDVGVSLDYIDLWNEGDCITIYYQNIEGRNSVIRAIKCGE